MLELTFIDKDNTPQIITVSESCYEKLAQIGFSKKVEYKDVCLNIEGEDYNISAVQLNDDNRKKLLALTESERQKELEKLFKEMDENPTIKEIRENFVFIKELTEIYKFLKSNNISYFSYE